LALTLTLTLTLTLGGALGSQPAAPNCPASLPRRGPVGRAGLAGPNMSQSGPNHLQQQYSAFTASAQAVLPTSKPRRQGTFGSESRFPSGETAQACTARHQGRPWCHIYAWIPRGLRCGPWSGQERTFSTWMIMGRTTANDDTGATSSAHLAESRPLPTITYRFRTCLASYDRASSPRARVCGAWRENKVAAYYLRQSDSVA